MESMDNYSEFIFKRTYARWDYSKNRREDWNESVERYFNFMKKFVPTKLQNRFEDCKPYVLQKKVMPSMRALWSAGPALERNHIAQYNCCYLVIDRPRAFAETLFILMCGTGVGFSVERQYITNLPEIPILKDCDKVIVFEDSKEGWAKGYNEFINALFEGVICKYDLSKIRPAGSILKTFGGRASGPEPLKRLLDNTLLIFKGSQGGKLNSLECFDIVCRICDAVVVGGVRRSATLSLSNLSDQRMKHAKDSGFLSAFLHRTLANNSVAYTEKPDMTIFMEEWLNLARSGTGERGIFNRVACENIAKRSGRRKPGYDWGCNPSLRAGTKILTSVGVYPIEELQDKAFLISNINGLWKPAECWLSGKGKELLEVKLGGGHNYYATKEHKWPVLSGNSIIKKTTEDLKPGDRLRIVKKDVLFEGTLGSYGDGFLIGYNLGDGNITIRDNGKAQIGFCVNKEDFEDNQIGHKILETMLNWGVETNSFSAIRKNCYEMQVNNECLRGMFNKFGVKKKEFGLPEAVWREGSEDFRKGLVDGLFSSDAWVGKNDSRGSIRICFYSCHKKLAEDVSELLGLYGIKNSLSCVKVKGVFPNGKVYNKLYTRFDVKIDSQRSVYHFKKLFKLSNKRKQLVLDGFNKFGHEDYVKVLGVKDSGLREDVWDITVNDDSHCFSLSHCVTGNCSEIILRPNSFCNLTEVVVRYNDRLIDLCEKVKAATILGCVQATLTDFQFISKSFKDNCEEERLLGVSLTGTCDHPMLNNLQEYKRMGDWLETMKETAVQVAAKWSRDLGINMPAAITCVKPSGTVSQLVNASSGIHPRFSPYYIRRVRVSSGDPMSKFLIDKGVPYSPETGYTAKDTPSYVFDFYIKSPKTSLFASQVSAIDQLNYWRIFQEKWCEHKPSCTVYVRPDEWLEVGAWVYKNWDIVSGISFFPYDDHIYPLAPYEAITKEVYDEKIKKFPHIDFTELVGYEKTDMTIGSQEIACSGGVCELK